VLSDVPRVRLDSMVWRVHTGHESQEFGTWTSWGVVGRIVSDTIVSLLGVGAEIIGARDSVLFRDTVSSFVDMHPDPIFSQVYHGIGLERVRPGRSVPVRYSVVVYGSAPATEWGCPVLARVIRLPIAVRDTAGRGGVAPVPHDETPRSPFYQWDPWTFDLDSALTYPPTAIALIDGAHADTAQSELIVLRDKTLFRERIMGAVVADSSRATVEAPSPIAVARQDSRPQNVNRAARDVHPRPGQTTLFVRTGGFSYTWQYPTGAPPPTAARLDSTLQVIRRRARERASRTNPAP